MEYWALTPYQGGRFCMINAYSSARGNSHIVANPPYEDAPAENWYSHGIIVCQVHEEKIVFDCDYKDEPTPAELSEYVRNMFYEKTNDQVLEVSIYHASNILARLDSNYARRIGISHAKIQNPKIAYEDYVWSGIVDPDERNFIRNHQ